MKTLDDVVLHADLDAFYPSCEKLWKPMLADKAVVVVNINAAGNGVVIGRDYEARLRNVKAGMTEEEAVAAYRSYQEENQEEGPELVIIKRAIRTNGCYDRYRNVASGFWKIAAEYGAIIKMIGLDEVSILTKAKTLQEGRALAEGMQEQISHELNPSDAELLTCSLGVSCHWLWAKLAVSEKAKRQDIRLLDMETIMKEKYWLPVGRIHGLGGKREAALRRAGIRTIGEFAKSEPQRLLEALLPTGFGYARTMSYCYALRCEELPLLQLV